jgi:hypothetical protein
MRELFTKGIILSEAFEHMFSNRFQEYLSNHRYDIESVLCDGDWNEMKTSFEKWLLKPHFSEQMNVLTQSSMALKDQVQHYMEPTETPTPTSQVYCIWSEHNDYESLVFERSNNQDQPVMCELLFWIIQTHLGIPGGVDGYWNRYDVT